MGKVLFGLLIAAIIWLLFFFKRKQKIGAKKSAEINRTAAVESIVQCKICGVNIPESEAIRVLVNDANAATAANATPQWRCRDGSNCSHSANRA